MSDGPCESCAYTSESRIELGRRVPALAVPSDVMPCVLSLLETLRTVWEIVRECWARREAGSIQITVHIPPAVGPLHAVLVELHDAPTHRVQEQRVEATA